MKLERDVRRFHNKFDVESNRKPTVPCDAQRDFRIRLIREESEELIEALNEGSLHKIAAECVDLLYVTVGTAVTYGVRLMPFWKAIHQANMTKMKSPFGMKIAKPNGWQPADTKAILGRQIKSGLQIKPQLLGFVLGSVVGSLIFIFLS